MSLNQQLDITQPQTDARQGTVRQVAATVKLIEYPSLLGNRDTNAVIGNFQCELVAMQAAFYPEISSYKSPHAVIASFRIWRSVLCIAFSSP